MTDMLGPFFANVGGFEGFGSGSGNSGFEDYVISTARCSRRSSVLR